MEYLARFESFLWYWLIPANILIKAGLKTAVGVPLQLAQKINTLWPRWLFVNIIVVGVIFISFVIITFVNLIGTKGDRCAPITVFLNIRIKCVFQNLCLSLLELAKCGNINCKSDLQVCFCIYEVKSVRIDTQHVTKNTGSFMWCKIREGRTSRTSRITPWLQKRVLHISLNFILCICRNWGDCEHGWIWPSAAAAAYECQYWTNYKRT